MVITVGIGESAVSGDAGATIVTYALASCVAMTAYSKSKQVAGMVHIALPFPPTQQQAGSGPYYYAVTGVPLLLEKMCSQYSCRRSELYIRLFGGASSIRMDDFFKLGQRNREMIEKILTDMMLPYDASETGGVMSRTLEMDVETGKIKVAYQPINI